MYAKLRDRADKQFTNAGFGGKPIRSGQVGEIEIGSDGIMYKCLGGFNWVLTETGLVNVSDTPQIMPPKTELFTYGSESSLLGLTTVSASGASTVASDTSIAEPSENVEDTPAENITTNNEKQLRKAERLARREERQERRAERREAWEDANQGKAEGTISSAINNGIKGNWGTMAADIGVVAMKSIDLAAMGDKNFGAQSEAIDSAVHGVSSDLMKSGNPFAMAAGAALEGANFLTKAGGQTVQGFDVDINSSGYGDMGHVESSSSRDFSAALGPLGALFSGINQKKMQAKLAKRNEQAKMAMNAANIAEEQSFEQEARANSIQNTIMNNQIALSGGLDTSLLGG